MKYEIWGEICPAVTIDLNKDQSIITQQGGMSWMTAEMSVVTTSQNSAKGSFMNFLKGGKEFFAEFKALADHQQITLSATRAGKIVCFDIKDGYSIVGRKMRFLCAEKSVNIRTTIPTYNKHLPNGSGYYLQSYEGNGKVFLEMSGSVREKDLEAGERMVIESGNLAAWESTVKVTEQFYNNFKSVLMNGEGTLISVVEGPGKIWLQTTPISELSKRIIPYIKDTE